MGLLALKCPAACPRLPLDAPGGLCGATWLVG
ncbi:MAG: hypothetical protein [Siphoviridae sp. ctdEk19]|nr:MAG: hypothetical protein [Siphoviridae sp. ctdEk19]